jgi:hypothetical protein
MWHVWGTEEMYTGSWWGNLRKGDHLEDPGINERIILKWIFEKGDDWHRIDPPGSRRDR